MGTVLLQILVGAVLSWILLLIVIPIAQKMVEFSLPDWPERLWKLAVIALGVNVLSTCIGLIPGSFSGWAGMIASAIVAYVLLVKWFDIDLFGGVVIVVVSGIVKNVLFIPILLML